MTPRHNMIQWSYFIPFPYLSYQYFRWLLIGTYVVITAIKAAQIQYDNASKAQNDTMIY